MKKIFSVLLLTLLLVCTSFINISTNNTNSTDLDCSKEDVASMTSFVGYNASQDSTTKDVRVINNGCFIFDNNYKNIEFIGKINFNIANSICITMRTENTISNATYSRDTGYKFYWYSHGAGELYRQGTIIQSYPGGTIPALNTTSYLLDIKIVDTIDGGVHIQISINDTLYVDYTDNDTAAIDNISGTGFGIFNEGNSDYTLTGLKNYAQLEINDLANFSSYNATLDLKTNNVKVVNNGAFLFNSNYQNVSINSNIVFDSTAAVQFILRSTDTITNQSYSRTEGYHFLWYSHGALELYRKGALLQSLPGGTFPTIATGTSYNINIKTINTLAEHVLITISVNGTTYVSYLDRNEDGALLDGGSYGMFNEGNCNYSVTGNGLNYPVISPFIVSSAQGGNSSYNQLEDDGSITLNVSNAHANSGITYELNTTDSFGYTVNVTPIDPGSYQPADIRFTIGQKLSNGVTTVPDFYYENINAWSSCGYIVHWANNVVYVTRGSTNQYAVPDLSSAIASTACLPIEYGKTYRIELSITPFDDGSTRLIFKIDDIIYLNYFDRPKEGYTPVQMPKQGVDNLKPNLTTYASIFSSPQVVLNISQVDEELLNNGTPNDMTVISNDLGSIDIDNSTIPTDLNGIPTNFESGIIKYIDTSNNNFLSFNISFQQLGNQIEFGYENGYSIQINKSNINLYKNNVLLLRVDNTYTFNEINKNYQIEFGILSLSNSNMTQILFKVNNTIIINYLDSLNVINNTNNFYFKSVDYIGSIKPIGYSIPNIVITDGVNEDGVGFVGKEIQLNVDSFANNITYYVQESNSTPKLDYNLVGNLLTVNQEGTICVYAKVGDLYTNYYYLNIESPTVSFTNLPSEAIEVGSLLQLNVSISDGRNITSIKYEILSGNELITITDNGIYFVQAGTVQIKAIVEDEFGIIWETSDDDGIINIIPIITLNNDLEIQERASMELDISFNCPVNEDDISIEIINGNNNLSLVNNTITALNIGQATIRVTYAKGKAYEASKDFTFKIFGILIDVPNAPIIIGGEIISVTAYFSNDNPLTNQKYFAKDGTGSIKIDEITGKITPIKAGTATIYVTANGYNSDEVQIVVLPKITIKNSNTISLGGSRYLEIDINSEIPNEDIFYVYELIDGSDCVTLNSENGYITATKIGTFRVMVTMIADSFIVYSPQVEIAIESPITVVDKNPSNMYVGESQQISYSFGNGEVPIQSAYIKVEEGQNLIEINNMTIIAKGIGRVKFRVVVNNVEGISYSIYISELQALITASDMYVLDSQNISIVFNDESINTNDVQFKISDSSFATIDNNTLTSTGKIGSFDIIALLNDKEIARKTINILPVYEITNIPGLLYIDKTYTINVSLLTDLSQNNTLIVNILLGDANIIISKISNDEFTITFTPKTIGDLNLELIINDKYSQNLSLSILDNVNTIVKLVADDMKTSSTQTLSIITEGDGRDPIVEYRIINGTEYASINNNILTSNGLLGSVTIGVYVNNSLVLSKEINIYSRIIILGVTNNQDVIIGNEYEISFDTDLTNIQDIQYNIISGNASFTNNILTPTNLGIIEFEIIIDSNHSNVIRLNAVEEIINQPSDSTPNNLHLIISLSIIGGIIGITGVGALIIYKKKRGNKNE